MAVLMLLLVSGTLLIATRAQANHFHTYNNVTHGIVHGSSDSDGAFFGRTYGYYGLATNYCGVGDASSGWYYVGYTYNYDLCFVFSYNYTGAPDECQALSYNRVDNLRNGGYYLSAHVHTAHSPPAYSCRVYPS